MPVNDVIINKGSGGLGATDPSLDQYSGLLAYVETIPAGFNGGAEGVVLITSLQNAVDNGITATSDDATAATGTIQVTGAGAEGETVTVSFGETLLGVAIVPATPTVDTLAAAIDAAINANSDLSGFTSTVSTDTVTVSAPKSLGESINTEVLTVVHSGTSTSTETAFSGGVGSITNVINYHIEEFFRAKPDGILYLGLYVEPVGAMTFAEIADVQNFANGEIRQIGIWQKKETFATSQLGLIQAILENQFVLHRPLEAILQAEISGVANITDLVSLTGQQANEVMVRIGQDGNNKGNDLFQALGKSVGDLGTALGSVAAADVATSIAYVAEFNVGATPEYQEPAFANGTLLNSVDENSKVLLSTRRYTFIRKREGLDGSFFNTQSMAIANSSDFATMSNNRTINKAARQLRTNLLPLLSSKLFVNPDGTLSYDTIQTFNTAAQKALRDMLTAGEISAFSTSIDPNQNVLSTSKIIVVATVVPVGEARTIEVPLSYALSVA